MLRTAVVGLFLYVVATIVAQTGDKTLPVVGNWWRQFFPPEYSGTAAISALIGITVPWLLNKLPNFEKFKSQRRAALEDGDQIGLLVDRSIRNGYLIELLLASSKAYIGVAVHGTLKHRDAGDILLVPIFSGYRDSKTRVLVLTTNYAQVIHDLILREDPRMHVANPTIFGVALPIRDVVSARSFDYDIYSEHFKSN